MKIERGVPIPPRGQKTTNGNMAVMRKLKKGESFVMEGSSQSAIAAGKQAFGAFGQITVRKIDNNSVRVWRIK